jgi:hypothetical protein
MDSFLYVLASIIVGTLAAIIISLRYVVIMERRIARMEQHLEQIVLKLIKQEEKVYEEELKIENTLGLKKPSVQKKSKLKRRR